MSGDSKRRELAFKDGSSAADDVKRIGTSTELNIRLWTSSPIQDSPRWLSWKSDYVPIQIISDLVIACNGVLLSDTQDRLMAKFESLQQAVAAAKRIQWALLGFFQDQPGQAVAAAIVVDIGKHSHPEESRVAWAMSCLAVSKPAQILVAEAVCEEMTGVPGVEFRTFGTEGNLHELVWAPPDTYRLLEQALNQPRPSAPPVPIEDTLSATRVLQSPSALGGSDRRLASQYRTLRGEVSESSNGIKPSTNDLVRPSAEIGNTTEAYASERKTFGIVLPTSRFRRTLLATGGVIAIFSMALIWVVVHKNAAGSKSARQQIETNKVSVAAPVVQSSLPTSRPSDEPVTHVAADAPPPAPRTDGFAAPVEPKNEKGKEDVSRERKSQSERKALESAKTAETNTSGSLANKPAEKAGRNCQLQSNEISAYLVIADKNRARGNYDDAIREYSAVIECDRHNARAQEGLVKTKQAQAVSDKDASDDSR
jgi:hypothetical protein